MIAGRRCPIVSRQRLCCRSSGPGRPQAWASQPGPRAPLVYSACEHSSSHRDGCPLSRAPRYVPVGPADALADGQRREYVVEGHELVVVRLDGAWYALTNRCPHQGGPLGRGRLEQGQLVCPWHQWRFDPRTGRSCWPEGYTRVAQYAVKVEHGQILVDLG